MLLAPIPANDDLRLEELDKLDLLYAEPEAAFDKIVHSLAKIFDMPVATMSLIDRGTQYYMSQVGLPEELARAKVFPREFAVCSHVVGNDAMLVVDDMTLDERFADNPSVTEGGMRFYAGAPMRTENGFPVGSLCIADSKPRHISEREQNLLQMIADNLMAEVKLRKSSRELRGISQRLAQRHRALERELNEAKAVQQFLLPPPLQTGHGLIVCHAYHPFDHIGGDFLDACLRDDGSAVLLLADVSGHGLSAALTSAMTKTSFQRCAQKAERPYDLLTAVNTDLGRTVQLGRFMTAVAAIYRPRDGSVEISSAGHPYPILLRGDRAELLKTSNEMPLLIDPEVPYSLSLRVELRAGDRLLFYTDGAIEASNGRGAMFEFSGLQRLVEAKRGESGEAFLKHVFEGVSAFANGKLGDDVALVCLECLP